MPFRFLSALGLLMLGGPPLIAAQDRRDEQFYYPGSFNWRFLKIYPEAARLFNAFDYGHAILYEKLYTKQGAEREAALEEAYQYLTTDLLVRPPRFAVGRKRSTRVLEAGVAGQADVRLGPCPAPPDLRRLLG